MSKLIFYTCLSSSCFLSQSWIFETSSKWYVLLFVNRGFDTLTVDSKSLVTLVNTESSLETSLFSLKSVSSDRHGNVELSLFASSTCLSNTDLCSDFARGLCHLKRAAGGPNPPESSSDDLLRGGASVTGGAGGGVSTVLYGSSLCFSGVRLLLTAATGGSVKMFETWIREQQNLHNYCDPCQ